MRNFLINGFFFLFQLPCPNTVVEQNVLTRCPNIMPQAHTHYNQICVQLGESGQVCLKPFNTLKCYYRHCNEEHKLEISRTWMKCDLCFNHYPSRHVLKMHTNLCYKKINNSCVSSSTQLPPMTISTDEFFTSPDGSKEVKMYLHLLS